ncbi:hypothetical protein ACFW17_35400 [Streptomyces sp. NPDC058961]|uniref:hypothetical protein n=1 Tax=Streptomyces sp. NPDC058961 TaxID=3346680 RepID=UPI00369DA233
MRPLLAERGCTIAPGLRLRTLAEVIDHLGADGGTGIIDGAEVRVRRPAAGRRDRERFISGKNTQNAVKSRVVTDADWAAAVLQPGRAGQLRGHHPRPEVGPGQATRRWARRGVLGRGRFKKSPPEWYEKMRERQRKAHSSHHIRVEHGIGHLKNWRSLARHQNRRERMSDIIQAAAGLLSHLRVATMASSART